MKTLYFTMAGLLLAVTLVMSCSEKETTERPDATEAITTERHKIHVDTITTELNNPWGIAFLPDGRILVTERSGKIMIVKDDQLQKEQIQGVPEVFSKGQGGLLDIQLHPDYESNGWIYLTYSKPGEGGAGTTVSRAKLDGNSLTELTELFNAQPFGNSEAHFGSRIVFDGKGYIFFTSGERNKKENAQDLSNHLGKVLRLHDDGKIPSDNPFTGTIGAKSEIWSYGHRNPQGLVYDKSTETLYAIEHGPRGGDELNKVEKGKNFGWPVITYGIDYNGTPISDIQEKDGMEQPLRYWVPSIAPCGMAQVTRDRFPNWKGNLLVGALAHTHIARVELNEGKYVKEEKILDKIGRVRAVAESPDGFIYVATEGPGMLLKISPVD